MHLLGFVFEDEKATLEKNNTLENLFRTFDSEFVVHDISVIETENGTFISMPSKRLPNGEYRDIAHPITSETRNKIQDAVLNAYANEIGQY